MMQTFYNKQNYERIDDYDRDRLGCTSSGPLALALEHWSSNHLYSKVVTKNCNCMDSVAAECQSRGAKNLNKKREKLINY